MANDQAQIDAARSAYNAACTHVDRWFRYAFVAIYTGPVLVMIGVVLMLALNQIWIGITGDVALALIWSLTAIRLQQLRRRVPPLHSRLRKLMGLPPL